MSKKFPPVKVISSFLGVDVGVKLVFDFYSGKYVSVEELEDVSEHSYYYSGSAIALDPFLVRDNVGEFFAYEEKIEDNGRTEGSDSGSKSEGGSAGGAESAD